MTGFRIGQGFDVHAFGAGDHLVLGGVHIPFDRGFVAHSDGDVLIHAVCDALFGAAALGDIGIHFPDTDSALRGADSRVLLRETLGRVAAAGWRPVNMDSTVIAQAPRLGPHIAAMRDHLAADLSLSAAAVSVKATTTEHLGFAGRKEGVAAQAIVLLEPASGVMRV